MMCVHRILLLQNYRNLDIVVMVFFLLRFVSRKMYSICTLYCDYIVVYEFLVALDNIPLV